MLLPEKAAPPQAGDVWRSAPSQSHDPLPVRHSARPKRVKDDRIPRRGCESNNGILALRVNHYCNYKYSRL